MTSKHLAKGLVFAFAAACSAAFAQAREVTFACQDMLVPWRTIIASGELERATGYKIKWRQFGGGSDVLRAMSAGEVQVGEAGSSPIAAAASQGHDVRLFWILDDIANAEALVVRNGSGIHTWPDLKGRRIATPFLSTSHYQLLAGLKLAHVDPKQVHIVNLRPHEIAAAWSRGDIDGAFVWEPALSRIKADGEVIGTSGDIGVAGYPTFDGLVVDAKWAAGNRDFLVALVKVVARADEAYRRDVARWTADSAPVKALAKWSKADPKDVPAGIAAYRFPTLQQQVSAEWLDGGAAKALGDTAQFLRRQGRLREVQPDYGVFVTDEYARTALATTP